MRHALIIVGLIAFFPLGALLFTNHFGVAIRISSYIYFILLLGVIYEIFTKE